MKPLLCALAVGSLVALVGCNASPTGGGTTPGTTQAGTGGTFKLVGPTGVGATEVKHGGDATIKVTVDRSSDFKEDVTLTATVEPSDKGVKATAPATIKKGDPKEAEIKVTAAADAAPGDYTVHVTGKPAKGEATTLNIKVKVPDKK